MLITASRYGMSFHGIAFSISLQINFTWVRYFVCGMIIIDISGASMNIKGNFANDMRYQEIEFANQRPVL